MTGKHTPGPWEADKRDGVIVGGPCLATSIAETPVVKWRNAPCHGPEWAQRIEQSEANTQLIAAAPCLLTALQQLVNTLDVHDADSLSCDRDGEHYCDCLESAIESAQQAIAKATGGTA